MNLQFFANQKRIWTKELGASMPEYALIIILVALIAVPTLGLLGVSLSSNFECQKNQVNGTGCDTGGSELPPPPPPPPPPPEPS